MPDQISDAVMKVRYEALHKLQQEISGIVNQQVVGTTQEILVADVEASRDRMTGRLKDFRLAHFAVDPANPPRPGDAITTVITEASPNFVIASNLPIDIRKTRGGDATQARAHEAGPTPIMVGMPTLAALKARQ